MQIFIWSRSGAGGLVWHRYGACLDDDRGDMRGRRGGLWEEMEGDMWGEGGSDLHDAKEDRKRTRNGRPQRRSKPVKSVYVTCANS
jgi:hypothetical protein